MLSTIIMLNKNPNFRLVRNGFLPSRQSALVLLSLQGAERVCTFKFTNQTENYQSETADSFRKEGSVT